MYQHRSYIVKSISLRRSLQISPLRWVLFLSYMCRHLSCHTSRNSGQTQRPCCLWPKFSQLRRNNADHFRDVRRFLFDGWIPVRLSCLRGTVSHWCVRRFTIYRYALFALLRHYMWWYNAFLAMTLLYLYHFSACWECASLFDSIDMMFILFWERQAPWIVKHSFYECEKSHYPHASVSSTLLR